jgi:hypothetical protein
MPSASRSSRALTVAYIGFILSRFYFYACFSASASDVEIYFRYATAGVDHGHLPYQDIAEIEYPPVAYWAMCLPRWAMSERFATIEVPRAEYVSQLQAYDLWFRGLMLAFDVAAFCLFAAIVRRRRPERLAGCIWTFTLVTSLLGYVLFERLDVGLNLSLLAWTYGALRGDDGTGSGRRWSLLGDAALGLGVSYKLIPIVIVPFAVLVQLGRLRKNPRDPFPWAGLTAMLVTAAGPFVYYYRLVGNDLQRMFRYHADRGVEIESIYSTAMMFLSPPPELHPYFDFGSWNLGGAWEAAMVRVSTPLLAVVLVAFGLRALRQTWRGEFDGVAAFRAAAVVIPTAVLLAKVFSVQYLIWASAMLILAANELADERRFYRIAFACTLAAALTGWIYPYHFVSRMNIYPYSDYAPPPWTLVENSRRGSHHGKQLVVGDLSNYGRPWWVFNVRNALYAGCVIFISAAHFGARRTESAK